MQMDFPNSLLEHGLRKSGNGFSLKEFYNYLILIIFHVF